MMMQIKTWFTAKVPLIAGLLQAIALYGLYLALSLTDPWGYLPPAGHLVFFIVVFLLMMGAVMSGLLGRGATRLRASGKWALLSMMILATMTVWAGPDRSRLLEVAVKPRAIFSYPTPEITVTVTPPAYSGREAFTERLMLTENYSSGLTPIPEGSEILLHVTNTLYAPTFLAGAQKVAFLSAEEGGFIARLTVQNEISWRIEEGSRLIGAWPVIILEDEAPQVERADFRALETEDGLFGLALDLSDDYGLETVAVGVVASGDAPDKLRDRVILPVSGAKNFSSDFYLNLSASDLAGKMVDLVVEATDQAGQLRHQVIPTVTLPEKIFSDPVASQIIEVRKGIKAQPDNRKTFARRLMALGLVPDDGLTSPVFHIALRSAYRRLNDPHDAADIDSGLDLLWELANSLEDGAVGRFKNQELDLLATLKLALYQEKPIDEVRDQLQEIDKNVILFLRRQRENQHFMSIDIPALRKLYGQILTHTHYQKYDQAIDLVSYLELGFIYPDKGILAGQGYERFQVIRQALTTVHDLEKSQRRIMVAAYKKAIVLPRGGARKAQDPELLADQKMHSWVMMQRDLGGTINDLGRGLARSGVDASELTVAAYDLMRDVVANLEAGNMEAAAQDQSQILTLLQSLKKRLDREMQFADAHEAENKTKRDQP